VTNGRRGASGGRPLTGTRKALAKYEKCGPALRGGRKGGNGVTYLHILWTLEKEAKKLRRKVRMQTK